jgi:hypothetical protein
MTAMIKRVRSTQRRLRVKIRITSQLVRTRKFYTEVALSQEGNYAICEELFEELAESDR